MKFIYFILIIAFGFVIIRNAKWIVDNTGMRSLTAENFWGPGGTYTAVKLIGLLAIAGAFYYTFGMN